MGSSIALAQGFKYAGIEAPVVATIGDGTFFHAGIPALLNASYSGTNITVLILDNHWISMTGMQPHMGTPASSPEGQINPIAIEGIVRAAGARNVSRVNPYQTKKMIETIKESLSFPGLSVVISDAECIIQRRRRQKGHAALKVKTAECVGLDSCERSCIAVLGCPAIERNEDGKAFIDPNDCSACGLCHHVCPNGAI